MGQDKQQLKKLLYFVKAVYDNPENSEFAKGLHKIVEGDIVNDGPHIQNIEKYLSLDFGIDEVGNTDFAFIEDDYVREKLNADFREMLRYQFGTRGHKVDFPEFCRFAILQVEMLVNYYYEKRYNADIALIEQALLAYNPKTKFNEKITNVSEIALKLKILALKKEFSWQKSDITVYLNSVEVRNRQSHRSLIVYTDKIKETEDYLKGMGLMNEKGYIDYKNCNGRVDQTVLDEYNFEKWYDELPFEKVISGLNKLAETVKNKLANSQ